MGLDTKAMVSKGSDNQVMANMATDTRAMVSKPMGNSDPVNRATVNKAPDIKGTVNTVVDTRAMVKKSTAATKVLRPSLTAIASTIKDLDWVPTNKIGN
jgi:hypothetical protein